MSAGPLSWQWEHPGVPTFGIEEEFLLIHPETGRLASQNERVASAAKARGTELQLELTQCQVESATPVCRTTPEADAHLRISRKNARCAADDHALQLIAAGVSPAQTGPVPVTNTPRYQLIAERFGIVANEYPLCGCHIHVALSDPHDAAGISNHLRPWLPTLLALSANSAICNGVDTGYASWRSIMWRRWPTAGPPPYFADPEQISATLHGLMSSGVLLDDAMLYWDIRASSHVPTMEIRVCDVPATVDETMLLATLTRAAVMTALDRIHNGDIGPPVSDAILGAAYWRAAKDGIEGELVDFAARQTVPARANVDSLVSAIRPALDRTGDYEQVLDYIDRIFADGNGAVRQRTSYRRRGRVTDVVEMLAQLTVQ